MNEEFFKLYSVAHGEHGLGLLAWWVGSLFAKEMYEKHGDWPFLIIFGDPCTGKSTAINSLAYLSDGESEINIDNLSHPELRRKCECATNPYIFYSERRPGIKLMHVYHKHIHIIKGANVGLAIISETKNIAKELCIFYHYEVTFTNKHFSTETTQAVEALNQMMKSEGLKTSLYTHCHSMKDELLARHQIEYEKFKRKGMKRKMKNYCLVQAWREVLHYIFQVRNDAESKEV